MPKVPIPIALLAALSLFTGAIASEPADNELRAALNAQPRSAHGARIYAKCVACHGKDGGGSTNGITPALAGQHARYLIKQIAEFRDQERFTGDVHDNAMREYIVNAQGIADVAAYLAELPPARRSVVGSGHHIARGEELFRGACESCHGEAAIGSDDLGIPVLHGQHYQYLVRQMRDIMRWHRVNTPPDLALLMRGMSTQDIEAIADYLSRLDGTQIASEDW
jgi:cytochrome c553